MLDQVDVAFLKVAPIIAELSFLRVIELHWNLDIGGEFALDNLVLYNCKLHRSVQIYSC
jgi:hypothetical protein